MPAIIAGLLLVGSYAEANTFCVSTVKELRAALADAGQGGVDQGVHNTIKIVQGVYHLGGKRLVFNNGPTDGHTLEINGGYNSDCSVLTQRASLTVLDAGSASPVLQSDSDGDLAVRYLTLRNGVVSTQGFSGLSANLNGGKGEVILKFNIFRNNAGGFYSVGVGGTSEMQVDGNLFVGNSAEFAAISLSTTAKSLYFTNNTVVENEVTVDGVGTAVLQLNLNSAHTTAYLSNNIIWNNGHGTSGQDIFATGVSNSTSGSALLISNSDYLTFGENNVAPSGINNMGVDPQFAGANNFRLSATSPLLGAGTLTPPGGLPAIDLVGNPRTSNNTVDMGAYERTAVATAADVDP